jgi:HEAT repeat protein
MKETKEKSTAALHEKFLAQLKNRSATVRAKALQSLSDLGVRSSSALAKDALLDASPIVRATAVEVLAGINDKTAKLKILPRLKDQNAEVRMRAAEALGSLRHVAKAPVQLVKLLKDRDVLVRVAAAESLGLIGDTRALPALRSALHDRSPLVRSYAAEAVGTLGKKHDLSKLTRLLQDETNELARVGFYKGLYKLGEKKALQNLITTVNKGKDYRARSAAANTLAELRMNNSDKTATVQALRSALRSERTIAARSSIRSSLDRFDTNKVE